MRNMAYKYRIYPDRDQEVFFRKTFGCCRFVYNRMLSDKKAAYEKEGKIPQITPARYKKEYEWLKEVDSLALANTQLHLEAAFRRYFDKTANGFPKFKSKHCSSERFPEVQVQTLQQAELHNEHGKREYPDRGEPAEAAKGRKGKDPPASEGSRGLETEVCHDKQGSIGRILRIDPV